MRNVSVTSGGLGTGCLFVFTRRVPQVLFTYYAAEAAATSRALVLYIAHQTDARIFFKQFRKMKIHVVVTDLWC